MNNNRNKKIEEILGSLDGTQKAAVPDFFYTRLKARMLARQSGGEKGLEPTIKKSWVLRPGFAFAALGIVLLINAVVILKGDADKNTVSNDSETIQSIAAEYSLNDNSLVYDLNQDK